MAPPSRTAAIALLVTVLLISSMGLAASVALPSGHAAGSTATRSAGPATPSPSAAPVSSTGGTANVAGSTNLGSAMAAAALAATKSAGLKPNVVFVPRASATPAQVAATAASGVVQPLYTGSPAPMGLAYYGLSAGAGGAVVPAVLNTTSLIGTVDMNATGVVANDLYQSSPDSYGIQLNAVVTNVTLFGHSGYSFWTQNVVEFYPDADVMFLVTNVWNFSGGPLSSNVFYAHGPLGTQVGTEYYYAETAIGGFGYPFNLSLVMNSTLSSGRNSVDFDVQLAFPGSPGFVSIPYDYVVFNSLKSGGTPLTQPSPYTADGRQYNPIGLTDDFELIFGGPGGGSQSTLFAADATLGLTYWNGSAYVSVPSAYNYGGETGETVTGANIAWSSGPGGPTNVSTYGTMSTGPSILTGLWNASGAAGSYPVTLDVTPANAFNLLSPSTGWSANFTVDELALAPELNTHTLYLEPGNYTLLTELSDYAPQSQQLDVTGPMNVTITLTPDRAFGVYTPLWAFSNAEIEALSTAGNGTAAHPYILDNNQYGPIGAEFGLYNDYAFPVYPAVFFVGTNASAEFLDPPSFSTATNDFAYPGSFLPAVNDLQYWFWNVSGVAIVDASNISGWFSAYAYYPVVFDSFSVIFYEGGHNLVANDTFDSEGQGLLMFSGGTFFGPINVGGGNNTVWGNVFATVPAPGAPYPLMGVYQGLGLEIAESNDLVYNNAVLTPTTAWLLPINLYSGDPEFFTDSFNISKQPASVAHYAPGFPNVALKGSILGTAYQGGNYWWDYGNAVNPYNGANNPYGLLPYEERASTLIAEIYGPGYYHASYIYPGGDYVPLTTVGALYAVSVTESGLPTGTPWEVVVVTDNLSFPAYPILDELTTTASSVSVSLPNGSYAVFAVAAGWTVSKLPLGFTPVTISGAGKSLSVVFKLAKGAHKLTFHEKGLPKGTAWSVTLNGTSPLTDLFNATVTSTASTIVFSVAPGSYNYTVVPVAGFTPTPASGSVSVGPHGGVSVRVAFAPVTYAVTFEETGLAGGSSWKVTVGHQTISSTSSSITFQLANGTYTYKVRGPHGTTPTPSTGTLVVVGSVVVEMVTFT